MDDVSNAEELAAKVHNVLGQFDMLLAGMKTPDPYEVAIFLEEKYDELSVYLGGRS